MEVLQSLRDLQQLLQGFCVSRYFVFGCSRTHQSRPRYIRVRRDVFDDVAIIPPVIDKRELVERHVHTTEWENMGMGQPP